MIETKSHVSLIGHRTVTDFLFKLLFDLQKLSLFKMVLSIKIFTRHAYVTAKDEFNLSRTQVFIKPTSRFKFSSESRMFKNIE